MLGVFDGFTAKQPLELSFNLLQPRNIISRGDIANYFNRTKSDADKTFYNFCNGNFMAIAQSDDLPQRSVEVLDGIVCIFWGTLDNMSYLEQFYGLPRGSTEAAITYAAYKTVTDQGQYSLDYVVKEMNGSYAFMLFDSKVSKLFLSRDRDGRMELHWGTSSDGSLVCSEDSKIIADVCGSRYTPFPQGCFFLGGYGVVSFDHPYHMVKAIEHKDEIGRTKAIIFQVDLYSRFETVFSIGSDNSLPVASTSNTDNENDQEIIILN